MGDVMNENCPKCDEGGYTRLFHLRLDNTCRKLVYCKSCMCTYTIVYDLVKVDWSDGLIPKVVSKEVQEWKNVYGQEIRGYGGLRCCA